MKKLKIIAAALSMLSQSVFAQFPATVTDIGQGGTFSVYTSGINNVCINQLPKSIQFTPSCPTGSGITNLTTTTTFSALGGAQINSQTTAGIVTFQMISTSVTGPLGVVRNPTGRIYVDYKCSYDSTYTVSYCNSNPITTTVRISRIGRSHIDFFQIFNWNRPIVGPACVRNGEEVTYSIFDYLSGPIDNQDVYTWTYPAAWTLLYYSYDKSSITLKANTVNPGDQITVRVGNCNTAIATKPISSPGVVVTPTIVKNYCLGTAATTWPVAFMTNTPDPTINYSWDIAASGAGFTYASGGPTTAGPITVNIGSTPSGYILFKSSKVVGSGCPNAERIDTIRFSRAVTGSITGPACVTVGEPQTYTVSGLPVNTSIVWTLPSGMTPASGTTTTATTSITVNVTGALNYGTINAVAAPGACAGTITGLSNINPIPVLTAISGPVCAARNANVSYTATGSGYDNISWTVFGVGPTTGSTPFSVTIPSNFTGGTISAVANKGTCTSASVPYNVEWDATGINLTSLTADKTCINIGQNVTQTITYQTDAGFDSYTWNLPAGWSGTSTTNSITYTTNGTAGTVTVTAKNGTCGSTNSKSLALSVAPAVTVTNSGVVNGVVTLSVPTGATSYQWLKNFSTINGATTNFLILPNTGTVNNSYCVDVTNASGCVTRACSNSTSNPAARVGNIEETESTEAASIVASPNPASKLVDIKFSSALAGHSYSVVNVNGQVMTSGTFVTGSTLDVSSWADGMYILRSGNTTVKIQVAK